MRHLLQRHRRWMIVLSLVLLLPDSLAPLAEHTAAASAITANPAALSASVVLGQSASRTITLTNHTAKPLTPALYEAFPNATPSLTRQALTPALRSVPLPAQSARIEPNLLSDLAAAPDRQADFLVFMRDQADLSGAYGISDWAERGRYVFDTLTRHAVQSQQALRAQLTARGLRFQSLWIANAALVHGNAADVQAMSDRADVALVRANHVAMLASHAPARGSADACSPDQPSNPICWNVRKIGADRVWQTFGVNGGGVVVANIDTGVEFEHAALVAQYRGYKGPGLFDHNYNWFEPSGVVTAPADTLGHGTHTMGTIAGKGDGTLDRPSIGVAPGARWVAAQGCKALLCADSDLLAAAQWMLAPTDLAGRHPRPDLRPMIVNNSWADSTGSTLYSGYVAAWRAAGIFPVFAAGNDGIKGCGSIGAPAEYPDVVGVGATNASDAIAPFSGRGPTRDGRLKPDFSAPGQSILSAFLGSDSPYTALDGTSMAAPHMAGVVALLWSANPALIGNYDATYALLRDTALRIPDSLCGAPKNGQNNLYGYGRVDAFEAVRRARVDVPWLSVTPTTAIAANGSANLTITLNAAKVPGPGSYGARLQLYGADLSQPPTTIAVTMTVTAASRMGVITGRVVSADTGAPVAATVGVADGLGVATGADGEFRLTLAAGTYDLVASALSFFDKHISLDVTGDRRLPDVAMRPDQPHLKLSTATIVQTVALGKPSQLAIPIANTGTQPVSYQARVLLDPFAATRSDETGGPGYQWIDLPSSARKLTLKDNSYVDKIPLGIEFPFYNYVLTETLATSNGTLAFVTPLAPYGSPSTACFPDSEYVEIAPFRADLDPSRGGTVRYGSVDNGKTFVLSYENVPLHTGPVDDTYTFQVLLRADGRITFQYRSLAALPPVLAVGLQREVHDYMALGCGLDAPIHDNLAIELWPQVVAPTWIHLNATSGTLAPGGTGRIGVRLDWIRPDTNVLRGRIEITSTDPIRSRLIVPVRMLTTQAPHELTMPLVASGWWN